MQVQLLRLSASEMNKFRRIHKAFWPLVAPVIARRASWNTTDDAIVLRLVGQVAVIGNSEAETRLRQRQAAWSQVIWRDHLDGMEPEQRAAAIHSALRSAGVRWAGRTLQRCRYSMRIAKSLDKMEDRGGPRKFMSFVARLRDENDRLAHLQTLPVFRGNKSPRDFLSTGMGLADWKVALDTRLLSVLREISPSKFHEAATPSTRRYLAIEDALVSQVCPDLGITGFELDQLLYRGQGRDERIVRFLRTGTVPMDCQHTAHRQDC